MRRLIKQLELSGQRRDTQILSRSSDRFAGPEDDDLRADWGAVVEIDDVLVRQADTAGRDVGANGPGFIGAVNAESVSLSPE